jgi:dihydropteroate synthase
MSKDQPSPGTERSWLCRDRCLPLPEGGILMGILNVTPDSFSDRGSFFDVDSAVLHAKRMLSEGATIIDVGGESTRPGALEVPAGEESARVLPVIRYLSGSLPDAVVSIDTSKVSVAKAALEAGARIINDVTGLRGDPGMAQLAAETRAGLVIMHMQGSPRTMQDHPHYDDVIGEIRQFFERQIDTALTAGVDLRQIVLDPGIGFGKNLEHNLEILQRLDQLPVHGRPILLGVSRKSFFHQLLGLPIGDRALATAVVTGLTASRGVAIHRVHDVAESSQALRLAEALRTQMSS